MVGVLLIAAGLGLLWSAKAYARDVAALEEHFRAETRRQGCPRWLLALLYPRFARSPEVRTRANQAVGAAVIVAGLTNVAGLWS